MNKLLPRLINWALVILAVHALTFLMIRGARGGPFDADRELAPEVEQALQAEFHLDESLPLQYWRSLKNLSQFKFGPSMRYRGYQVEDIISEALPISLLLGIGALCLALMLGIPAGLWAAKRHQKFTDNLLQMIAGLVLSIPNFVIAGLLLVLFSFSLKWLPPAGLGNWQNLIMPILALGLPFAASLARLSRNAALEALESPPVHAATARGVPSRTIMRRHILRRALLPVVAYLGPAAAGVLTGSLVIEQVFALPGLGTHFIQAALNRDYTLALGVTVCYTAILGTSVLFGDIALSKLDPQVESL